ncbi:MAG: PadR family transcriptional regulator [Thermoplasmataceae archaeon]
MSYGEYFDSALFILSLKPMNGYELSRRIKWDGTTVSGGTIRPLLKVLEREDMVRHEALGKSKVYFLTEKGKSYVNNLREFRSNIRNKMLATSMNRDILFPEILVDLEDSHILNDAIDKVSEVIIEIVKSSFILTKKERLERLDKFKGDILSLIAEMKVERHKEKKEM